MMLFPRRHPAIHER